MTWFRVGGGSGVPESLKSRMNSVLNKKYRTFELDYPPNEWPDDVDLLGLLEEKTTSGLIANILDGADRVPTTNVIATIAPNLDGVSSVDVTRIGKNLFDKDNPNEVDGYFTTTGFNTGNANAKTIYLPIIGGITYTVSKNAGQRFQIATAEVIPSNGATFTDRQYDNTATHLTITASANDKYLWAWVFLDGTDSGTLAEMLNSVQIEVGSEATTYQRYSAPTVFSADLGRTIHGGTADIVTGEGQETHAKMTFTGADSENWQFSASGSSYRVFAQLTNAKTDTNTFESNLIDPAPSASGYPSIGQGWINNNGRIVIGVDSSITSVADWKEYLNNNNMEIAYELADEYKTDFTFTGQRIETMLGVNNFWNDADGDTSVTYRSSGTMTPNQPTLITKTITANGSYQAADDQADGYSEVVVNVTAAVDPIMSANAFVTKSGVSGTDTSTVARSFTMSSAGKLIFAPGTYGFTNTGSNDGYFEIQKNGVSVVKQYCNTSTNTPITVPEISVEENDVVDLVVGFDNAHSNCNFQFYSAMVVVSEV